MADRMLAKKPFKNSNHRTAQKHESKHTHEQTGICLREYDHVPESGQMGPEVILSLQKTIGNRAIVQRQPAPRTHTGPNGEMVFDDPEVITAEGEPRTHTGPNGEMVFDDPEVITAEKEPRTHTGPNGEMVFDDPEVITAS